MSKCSLVYENVCMFNKICMLVYVTRIPENGYDSSSFHWTKKVFSKNLSSIGECYRIILFDLLVNWTRRGTARVFFVRLQVTRFVFFRPPNPVARHTVVKRPARGAPAG